jgi:hypothetical protein
MNKLVALIILMVVFLIIYLIGIGIKCFEQHCADKKYEEDIEDQKARGIYYH